MAFQIPTYDELLNTILTDFVNQFPGVDISKGSLIYVRSAATASALWGLYQYQQYVANQIFPDSCDVASLEHWASVRGLALIPSESPAELQSRVLEHIRRPPAGGNQYDYVTWAKSVAGVAGAWCVPLGQGVGTVDVLILADSTLTGSEIPTAELLAEVRAFIADICPVSVKYLRVMAPDVVFQNVTIVRTGATYPAASAIADITFYLQSFAPGDPLYRDQLIGLALGEGSGRAPITTPAADVEPLSHQMLRPGVINVA